MLLAVKANTARRMSRCEQDLKYFAAEVDGAVFFQKDQFTIIILKWQLPSFSRCRSILKHRNFLFMDMQDQVVFFAHETIAENMIEVTVCVQQQHGLELVIADE